MNYVHVYAICVQYLARYLQYPDGVLPRLPTQRNDRKYDNDEPSRW